MAHKTAMHTAIEQAGSLEISNDHLMKVRALLVSLLPAEREQIEQAWNDGCHKGYTGDPGSSSDYYTQTFTDKNEGE